MKIIHLNLFNVKLELNKWYDAMLRCPSQCYRHVQDDSGVSYILYLRWRHDDPWTADIVRNAYNEESMHDDAAEWVEDIFRKRGLYFTEDQVSDAKNALILIFNAEYRQTNPIS